MIVVRISVTFIVVLLFVNFENCIAQDDANISGKTQYEPTWSSLAQHETPEWFEDAVLGIYFHWGIYSVPAFGCWGGRNMYMPDGGTSENWGHIEDKYKNTHDYVKKVYGDPGLEFGYKDFVPMFKAEKWDPDEWAEFYKEIGVDGGLHKAFLR